jgi:hypothetical protein
MFAANKSASPLKQAAQIRYNRHNISIHKLIDLKLSTLYTPFPIFFASFAPSR